MFISSDLWVGSTIQQSTVLNQSSLRLSYGGGGKAIGPVKTATVDFAGYTISNQAYGEYRLRSSQHPDPDTRTVEAAGNATGFGNLNGIIGLGPSDASAIFREDNNSSAASTLLDNIFHQNTSAPNTLGFLLSRDNDPSGISSTEIAVGEITPGYDNVQSMPHLAVPTTLSQHWQVLIDDNGIIGPDGNVIPITSNVSGISQGQAVALLDTGTSLAQVPA